MRKAVIAVITGGLCCVLAMPANAATSVEPAPSSAPVNTVPASPAPTAPASAAPAKPTPAASTPPTTTTATTSEPQQSVSAPQLTNRLGVEATYALGQGKASDKHGVAQSLYTGKWFKAKFERKRRCIVRKETGGNYNSVSSNGQYRGAYQMSRSLAVGAAWMMEPEVKKELGAAAAATVAKLRKVPIQQWNRYWQDRAFWTIWRHGKGKSHWRVRGC